MQTQPAPDRYAPPQPARRFQAGEDGGRGFPPVGYNDRFQPQESGMHRREQDPLADYNPGGTPLRGGQPRQQGYALPYPASPFLPPFAAGALPVETRGNRFQEQRASARPATGQLGYGGPANTQTTRLRP